MKAKEPTSPPTCPQPDSLLSAAEVVRLGISAITLRRWVGRGLIKPQRVSVRRGNVVGYDFRFRYGEVLWALECARDGAPGRGGADPSYS